MQVLSTKLGKYKKRGFKMTKEEIKRWARERYCNNYRRMHRLPLIKRRAQFKRLKKKLINALNEVNKAISILEG